MILKRLEAENFQRYEKIVIDDLPERGIVGVVGENESGKTTLGEAISFALFGRTLRLDGSELREVINWGADSCRVRLTFSLPDASCYTVSREVDRSGTYSADLADELSGELVARGVGKVNARLAEMLSVSFEDFRYSFYLGQKELGFLEDTTPEARRGLLDRFIGVSNIEEAAGRVAAEIEKLRERRRELREDASVHREVVRQIAVDPADCDRARERLEALGLHCSQEQGELEELNRDLEDGRRRGRALDVARTLGLRAVVRGYGVAFGSLAGWLRQAAGTLRGRIQAADRAASEAAARLEHFRVFEARCNELASVVRGRQQELDAQLRNTLEADWSPETAEFITPNSKSEQLSFTRKKLESLLEERETLMRASRRRISAGALLWLLGFGFLFWQRDFVYMPFVVFGILYMLWGIVNRYRAAEQDDGRARLGMNLDRLNEEVGKLENARQACLRFDARDSRSMADNLPQVGSSVASQLYSELKGRYSAYLDGSEGQVEALEGAQNTCREEADSLRREAAEVDMLASDLEEELERLSRAGHARVARPPGPASDLAYERGDARKWRARVRLMIERCRKAHFQLELVPAEALDRDFAELEPSLAELPGASLDVAVLSQLDAGASALDATRLEGILEKQGEALSALEAGADELRRHADQLENRKRALMSSLEGVSGRMNDLKRELERLEPAVVRVRELEKTIAGIEEKSAAVERDLDVHVTLLEVFRQCRDQMRERFGPQIAQYIAWVLPQLTSGRYRDVKVSPELDVEVFSQEKNDWVTLSSLSGGTVDQLFLTLRLAFSKALVQTKLSPGYKQYLFFDEPLSSFDESRGGSFLELLRKFQNNFDQVFVVTHTPGSEAHFDRLIQTSIEKRELLSH